MMTHLKVESVVETLLLADKYQAGRVKQACVDYFVCNSAQVKQSPNWELLKERADLLWILIDQLTSSEGEKRSSTQI